MTRPPKPIDPYGPKRGRPQTITDNQFLGAIQHINDNDGRGATPTDLHHKTGLTKNQIRYRLRQYEQDGIVERNRCDCGHGEVWWV